MGDSVAKQVRHCVFRPPSTQNWPLSCLAIYSRLGKTGSVAYDFGTEETFQVSSLVHLTILSQTLLSAPLWISTLVILLVLSSVLVMQCKLLGWLTAMQRNQVICLSCSLRPRLFHYSSVLLNNEVEQNKRKQIAYKHVY